MNLEQLDPETLFAGLWSQRPQPDVVWASSSGADPAALDFEEVVYLDLAQECRAAAPALSILPAPGVLYVFVNRWASGWQAVLGCLVEQLVASGHPLEDGPDVVRMAARGAWFDEWLDDSGAPVPEAPERVHRGGGGGR